MLPSPTALTLSLMLIFSELTWTRPIRSKATWAKSFLMLLAYRNTVRRAVAINVCGRKSSCERFQLATTHAKVANSGKMVIPRYRIRYFFQKKTALALLENELPAVARYFSRSLLPTSGCKVWSSFLQQKCTLIRALASPQTKLIVCGSKERRDVR